MAAAEEYIGCNEVAADAAAMYAEQGIARSAADCTPYHLAQAARQGDAVALRVFENFAEKLACLIMNMMYAFVPEAFIIGGGVAKAGDWLFKPLREYVKNQVYAKHFAQLKILPAMLSNEAGMVGAAAMALREAGH